MGMDKGSIFQQKKMKQYRKKGAQDEKDTKGI